MERAEKCKRELAKDDQFMALFAQFVANMKQNPGPSTSRPVAVLVQAMGLGIAQKRKSTSQIENSAIALRCARYQIVYDH